MRIASIRPYSLLILASLFVTFGPGWVALFLKSKFELRSGLVSRIVLKSPPHMVGTLFSTLAIRFCKKIKSSLLSR